AASTPAPARGACRTVVAQVPDEAIEPGGAWRVANRADHFAALVGNGDRHVGVALEEVVDDGAGRRIRAAPDRLAEVAVLVPDRPARRRTDVEQLRRRRQRGANLLQRRDVVEDV